jgi:ArsR family transcriptional regulator
MSNNRSELNAWLAGALKALAHPKRLEIYRKLVDCCGTEAFCRQEGMTACVSDLGEGLEAAPSTVSHHIRELRIAGLIEAERRGKEVHCRVSRKALAEISDYFDLLKGKCCQTGVQCTPQLGKESANGPERQDS